MKILKSTLLLTLFFPCILVAQVEICDNGIDDDEDSLIDLNDEDCFCEVVDPVSLIPNPSFEDQNCCPSDRSQLDCASGWIQASEPTTDYIHTCDYLGWDQFPPPQPFPDGDGIMGFRDGRVRQGNLEPSWKEYAGACLINPLNSGEDYRFQFDLGFVDGVKSPPIDVTFFGTTSCDYLPFGVGNEEFGCPTNGPNWVELASINVSGGGNNIWVNTFLDVVPNEDIYAIAIGPSCRDIPTNESLYYFFDNLLLTDFEFFQLLVSETTHPCDEDWSLSVAENPAFDYQWYLGGIALVGETDSELSQDYGEGLYQVRIISDGSCKVSVGFERLIPVFEDLEEEVICDGDIYSFGDLEITEPGYYTQTFSDPNGCDIFVTLDVDVIGAQFDTIAVSLLSGQSYQIGNSSLSQQGDYPVTLSSSIGCDSLVLVQLEFFDIFIPNVFGPNFNTPNNAFKPFAADGNIASVNMSIYDRWGNLMFKGEEWGGQNAEIGVYVYHIVIEFFEGDSHSFSGDVTLVR